MSYNEVMARVDDLKMEALNGDIPTWLAYQEIDRLMSMLEKGK